MQRLYDRGIFTGWALVVEMIERGDCLTLESLAESLKQKYQGRIDERLQLAINHMVDMYRVLSLPKNSAKGSWEGIDVHKLLDLARREFDEFVAAIWKLESGKGSVEHVAAEGCDISAFIAMITDNYRRKSV